MKYILKATTIQGSVIKTLSEAMKDLVSDVNLVFTKKVEKTGSDGKKVITGGISAVAMCMSNNVLMHLTLNASEFESYECNKERVVVGINTMILFKVMKTLNNHDTVTLFIDEEDSNKLGIRFVNAEKSMVSTKKINLLEIDEYEIEIPPSKFSTWVVMPSNHFNKICRDLNSLAETVDIKSVKQKLILKADGDNVSGEMEIGQSDNGITIFTEEKDRNTVFQGLYDIKYLCTFTKCTNLCPNVEIFIKNDFPLLFKYSVASLGTIYLCLSSKTDPNSLRYEDMSDDSDSSDSEDSESE